jgi:hypothetical protein
MRRRKNSHTARPASWKGHALRNQVFKTNGGEVVCTKAAGEGLITLAFTEQEMTVNYSGCTAFGIAEADVSEADYAFKAKGSVQILDTIEITPTSLGTSACTVTIAPQTVSAVAFANYRGAVEVGRSSGAPLRFDTE